MHEYSDDEGDQDSSHSVSYPYDDEDSEFAADAHDHESSDDEEHEHDQDEHRDRFLNLEDALNRMNRANNESGNAEGSFGMNQMFPELLSMLREGSGSNNTVKTRLDSLIKNVGNCEEDSYIAMESLRELSEQILMTNQLVLDRALDKEQLITNIMTVFSSHKVKDELELQMQACRCLYNLFEVSPETINMALEENVLVDLQALLTEINYIDLAEQVLETSDLISRIHGNDILHTYNLNCYIQYFDFFTIHAQRKAISIISNSCARVKMEDFETIEKLFNPLKDIFINSTDSIILERIINILYACAKGMPKDSMLETLFNEDILNHLIQLVSHSETSLENKLHCLDILSRLADISGVLSSKLIESANLAKMLDDCLHEYSKSPDAPLHETLMFVPKPLLNSIARFIALLFPTESDRLLSADASKSNFIVDDDEKLNTLITVVTPILVEIYVNSIDFDVRRYVVLALIRVISFMKSETATQIGPFLIKLIGSALAQTASNLDKGMTNVLELDGLLVGILSILDILTTRFGDKFIPLIKREGIFQLIKEIHDHFQGIHQITSLHYDDSDIKNSPSEGDNEDHLELSDGDDEDEDESYDYDMGFGDVDIPESVKTKPMKFHIFKPLTLGYVEKKSLQLSTALLELFGETDASSNAELAHISQFVQKLRAIDVSFDCTSEDAWYQLWTTLKALLFNNEFEISGFELISTGLATALAEFLERYNSWVTVAQRIFYNVFETQLRTFVNILHSGLNRVENFDLVECGLQGEEGAVASLGKQIRIDLRYTGEPPAHLDSSFSSPTVSIHCIASFATLNDFLKHRFVKAQFLSTILPRFSPAETNEEESTMLHDDDAKNWTFEFTFDGKSIDMNDTIFGAIARGFIAKNKKVSDIWKETQVIEFKRTPGNTDVPDLESEENYSLANIYSTRALKEKDDGDSLASYKILELLRFVKGCGTESDMFINSKLSAKLSRQLDEPLIIASGILPDWTLQLTREYSFLFPFETRMFFLQCTSFGYGRLIELWKSRNSDSKILNNDEQLQQLGRMVRHKLRVSRKNMFLTGLKIIGKYGSSPSVLEIEYIDEVGSGLGPTLEFYASISKEFAKNSLHLWRSEDFDKKANATDGESSSDYVKDLLFPAPLDSKCDNAKTLELFESLGTFIARSMLDSRILDFRFNKLFFELLHKRFTKVALLDNLGDLKGMLQMLSRVDEQLAKSLEYLYDHKDDSVSLEALSLTFVLPGYNIELIPDGTNTFVNATNVEDFIQKVLESTLGRGIEKQLDAFIDGFSKVFPYVALLILRPEELTELFGRIDEDWSTETLYNCMNADHGYTMDSQTIHDLISIVTQFTVQERRLFCQFLTGSPKLPIDGFKGLKPKFTVVLKHAEDGLTPDQYLPSVMTCANYLKLPKYSSRDVMRARILQAIEEGAGAFLLS